MPTKIITLIVMLLLFNSVSYSQSTIIALTADQLAEKLFSTNKRASVVQYWIPNCATAESQVEQFKNWEENYRDEIDFYFIGITNKDSLVLNLMNKTNYNYPLYVADVTVDPNLNERMQSFSTQLNKSLKRKPQSFITLYWNNKNKKLLLDKKATVKDKELQNLLKG